MSTKKGSPEPSFKISLARAKGPAVPIGSFSCNKDRHFKCWNLVPIRLFLGNEDKHIKFQNLVPMGSFCCNIHKHIKISDPVLIAHCRGSKQHLTQNNG